MFNLDRCENCALDFNVTIHQFVLQTRFKIKMIFSLQIKHYSSLAACEWIEVTWAIRRKYIKICTIYEFILQMMPGKKNAVKMASTIVGIPSNGNLRCDNANRHFNIPIYYTIFG